MNATKSRSGGVRRPLRADAARNHARILQAARELFAERGLTATMDEVARRAGVGVGTVYRRFPDREGLIRALFEDHLDQVIANAAQAEADPDPWRGLVTLLERSVAMQTADRGLKELLHSPADLRERIGAVRERTLPIIERLVARAQEAGELRPEIAPTDVMAINCMLCAVADLGGADLAPDLWRRYLTILLDGLRVRRDAPTPIDEAPLGVDELDQALASCIHHARR